ncbi:MAG: hypothetical protein ACM3O7_12160 [Acidobacteriota bacterium]
MITVLTLSALLVVGWFAVGTIWNVRKGSAVMAWMHGGLPLMGERTTVRWLGSNTVEMVIQHANPPFERVAVVVFLEPRDVPWMWALSRRHGRRDTLIVRGSLRAAPRNDLEVLDPTSWSGRDALRRLASEDWLVRDATSPGGLAVYHKTPAALVLGDALIERAAGAGVTLRRLSLRRSERAFQLHIQLPSKTASAGDLFRAIHALADNAA